MDNVSAMFLPMIFEDRFSKIVCRLSKIDVSTFEDRRLMCRPSKMDISTFGDRCVDCQRSVLTFDDPWSM